MHIKKCKVNPQFPYFWVEYEISARTHPQGHCVSDMTAGSAELYPIPQQESSLASPAFSYSLDLDNYLRPQILFYGCVLGLSLNVTFAL